MSLPSELWSILSPAQRRSVLAAQLVSLAMALSTITGIASIAPFFAVLGNRQLIARQPLLHWVYVEGGFSRESQFLLALGAAFIAMVLIANLVNALGFRAMNHVALRIGNELRTTLYGEYLGRPYLFHARTHSASLFDRVVYETTRVSEGILQSGLLLVTGGVTGSLIFASVLIVRPTVAIAMALGLGGGYVANYLLVRRRLLRIGERHSHAWTEQARLVTESFGARREILLLRDRSPLCDEFARTSREVAETASRVQIMSQTPKYVMECAAAAALAAGALLLGVQNAGGGVWLGELTFIAFAAYRLLPAMQQIFVSVVRIRANRASLALIAQDLRQARARRESRPVRCRARTDDSWGGRPREGIRLEHVSFRYSPAEPWALEDVCMRIPARSMVGLVGPSGSGKTTLLDVIAGLIAPETGRLRIDDRALSDADRDAWREQVAYVPQNVFLLDASIARNIAFGVAESAVSRERVALAARLAHLEELIESHPRGFERRVGEEGIGLSGGQRQRIGIARALYRNASVLLLDEPTSALDGASEARLIDTLQQLRRRCTIVLVSHRLALVRGCDVIHQLDHGRVCEAGTFEALARKSEMFRPLDGAGP